MRLSISYVNDTLVADNSIDYDETNDITALYAKAEVFGNITEISKIEYRFTVDDGSSFGWNEVTAYDNTSEPLVLEFNEQNLSLEKGKTYFTEVRISYTDIDSFTKTIVKKSDGITVVFPTFAISIVNDGIESDNSTDYDSTNSQNSLYGNWEYVGDILEGTNVYYQITKNNVVDSDILVNWKALASNQSTFFEENLTLENGSTYFIHMKPKYDLTDEYGITVSSDGITLGGLPAVNEFKVFKSDSKADEIFQGTWSNTEDVVPDGEVYLEWKGESFPADVTAKYEYSLNEDIEDISSNRIITENEFASLEINTGKHVLYLRGYYEQLGVKTYSQSLTFNLWIDDEKPIITDIYVIDSDTNVYHNDEKGVKGASPYTFYFNNSNEETLLYVEGTEKNSGVVNINYSETSTLTESVNLPPESSDTSILLTTPVDTYFSNKNDGEKTIYVALTDSAGNISDIYDSSANKIIFDTISPVINISFIKDDDPEVYTGDEPTKYYFNNDNISLNYEIDEELSGIQIIKYDKNISPAYSISKNGAVNSELVVGIDASVDLVILKESMDQNFIDSLLESENEQQLTSEVIDRAGNSSGEIVTSKELYYDITPPEILHYYITDASANVYDDPADLTEYFNKDETSINFEVDEAVSGVNYINYGLAGSIMDRYDGSGQKNDVSGGKVIIQKSLNEDFYDDWTESASTQSMEAYAFDRAGNSSELALNTRDLIYDVSLPEIKEIYIKDRTLHNEKDEENIVIGLEAFDGDEINKKYYFNGIDTEITGEYADETSGVYSVYYGSSAFSINNLFSSFSPTQAIVDNADSFISGLSEGNINIYMRATDRAGNEAVENASNLGYTLIYDKTNPQFNEIDSVNLKFYIGYTSTIVDENDYFTVKEFSSGSGSTLFIDDFVNFATYFVDGNGDGVNDNLLYIGGNSEKIILELTINPSDDNSGIQELWTLDGDILLLNSSNGTQTIYWDLSSTVFDEDADFKLYDNAGNFIELSYDNLKIKSKKVLDVYINNYGKKKHYRFVEKEGGEGEFTEFHFDSNE